MFQPESYFPLSKSSQTVEALHLVVSARAWANRTPKENYFLHFLGQNQHPYRKVRSIPPPLPLQPLTKLIKFCQKHHAGSIWFATATISFASAPRVLDFDEESVVEKLWRKSSSLFFGKFSSKVLITSILKEKQRILGLLCFLRKYQKDYFL